jgi:ABC-type transport system substrate-binding protein
MRQGVSDTRYFTGAAVAEIEALARKAFAVIDAKERAELQRQVGQMFYDGYYTVPLAGKDTIFALSHRVKEWPFIPGVGYPQTNLEFVTLKR